MKINHDPHGLEGLLKTGKRSAKICLLWIPPEISVGGEKPRAFVLSYSMYPLKPLIWGTEVVAERKIRRSWVCMCLWPGWGLVVWVVFSLACKNAGDLQNSFKSKGVEVLKYWISAYVWAQFTPSFVYFMPQISSHAVTIINSQQYLKRGKNTVVSHI